MRNVVALVVMLAPLVLATADAQDAVDPAPVGLAEARSALPDHRRYQVDLLPNDMSADQQTQLATMIGDAAAGQHFYGAVVSYRPAAGGTTEYKMRSGLHSRDAAKAGAMADCEAARAADDGACTLIGEIVPEGWSADMPELSHLAVQALTETAADLPGNVVVARSRAGDGFEIRSGDDVRQATLTACNAANVVAGLPEDCDIVIDDLAGR
ncbi:hypothetical protein SAMN06295905_1918 [Devosia lucknowensis]|uniref:5-aminolevulic acid synthase n=1 Tax=Devosia lucknowensis TaxID=1096929 RepID=A0A1Y6FCI8_9HYPH|nr:hypothetical protein [Devosia lucknowensis]SMQ70890.1 hypothetical protein SAMN06295905_1918 [Devosia lucknowensis]